MGKTSYTTLITLILFLTFCPHLHLCSKTLKVGRGYTCHTISQALAIAAPHDVILVAPGTYKERLSIRKPITLKGIGMPVVDGTCSGHVISVLADSVIIDGLMLINSARSSYKEFCGVLIKECTGVVIKNNIFRDNSYSILLQHSNRCVIQNNKISTSIDELTLLGNAIHCWKCDSISITDNQVGRHRDGIYLEFVTHSNIMRNTVNGCLRYGLHFMFSHYDTYYGNRFARNVAGVAVMYSHHIHMSCNTFEQNRGESSYGLLLKEISDGTISNNTFRSNTIGIFMDSATNLYLKRNIFRENGWGMRVVGSSTNNVVTNNNFVGNTFDISTNSTYNSNMFDANYWDKYQGYDLDKDGIGDVPYHPLSLFSALVEVNPTMMLFFHGFIMNLLDKSEKILPSITPDTFKDNSPLIHAIRL